MKSYVVTSFAYEARPGLSRVICEHVVSESLRVILSAAEVHRTSK